MKANEQLVEEAKHNYSFYSNVLNQKFDTVEELEAAEKAHQEEQIKKETALATRKADAQKVDDMWQKLVEARKNAMLSIKEAEKDYSEAVNEFVKKYGSYHKTYSSSDGKYVLGVGDIIDQFFSDFFRF